MGVGVEIARAVLEAAGGGQAVCMATVIRAALPTGRQAPESPAPPPEADQPPAEVGAKMLVRADGSTLGSLGGGPLEAAVVADCLAALPRHLTETVCYSSDGRRVGGEEGEGRASLDVLIEAIEPAAVLLIVGGGHIGKALAQMGALLGFSVVVVDDRREYANRERFPEADRVICGDFEESLRDFPIDSNTYVVIVTRGHRYDEVSLRQVVAGPAAYVGMIGSRRRVGAVMQHLLGEGVPAEAVEHVHSPIGLDIGAETPEEIAVSIMAEIVQARRRGSGRPMREVKGVRRGRRPAGRED
ncbi:MAG: XdhC family protein [Chloroflexota bacterium]|nr:XdhC family protein [Chloroflexota bacterium]